MCKTSVVTFANRDGLKLFGTLHRAQETSLTRPLVILLSPGVKMRVGPGRLYVPVTERLNSLGFDVLRFDFYGLGDSEGELEESMLADVYNNIEVGRYVGDTLAAIDWAAKTLGAREFVLGGLCGGAITALLAAERDDRVCALLSIGMTVTLASDSATPAKYLTQHQLTTRRQGYLRKLLEPKSWARLLTLQSEYRVIWRSLEQWLRSSRAEEKPMRTDEQRGDANLLFPKAYLAFLRRGGRALMIFSGADRLYSQYQEKFLAFHANDIAAFASQITEHVVPNANHVLSFAGWRDEMVEVSGRWIQALSEAP